MTDLIMQINRLNNDVERWKEAHAKLKLMYEAEFREKQKVEAENKKLQKAVDSHGPTKLVFKQNNQLEYLRGKLKEANKEVKKLKGWMSIAVETPTCSICNQPYISIPRLGLGHVCVVDGKIIA